MYYRDLDGKWKAVLLPTHNKTILLGFREKMDYIKQHNLEVMLDDTESELGSKYLESHSEEELGDSG